MSTQKLVMRICFDESLIIIPLCCTFSDLRGLVVHALVVYVNGKVSGLFVMVVKTALI